MYLYIKLKKTNKTGNYNKEIFFDSAVLKRDKPKLYQKTNSLEQLKKYDVKNYKWLEKKINSLKPFQELDQFYDRIYIIQINPINKKAIITEVDNIEIIE